MILRRRAGFAKIELKENRHTGPIIMEIVGIGTDIVECLRIGRLIEQHGELFLNRVYTSREIRYCQERKRAIEHFAGAGPQKKQSSRVLEPVGQKGSAGPTWKCETIFRDSPAYSSAAALKTSLKASGSRTS